jgi:serine phosphatase RsbU (regulator of sigma subunit)
MTGDSEIIRKQEADAILSIDALNDKSFETRNNDTKLSAELAEKALAASIKLDYDPGKAKALANLGFYYLQKGQNDKAFEQLIECLAVYEKLKDEAGIALAFYNIGLVHLRLGNFNDAVEYIQKCIAIRLKLNDSAGLASCYFQMAFVHQFFNDFEASEIDARKSIEIRKELNDKIGLASSYMVLSDVYHKQKQFAKAKEILEQSLKYREGTNENMGYHATKQRWVEVNIELGNYDVARETANSGLKYATDDNIPLGIIRYLQSLGKLEERLGNKEEAKKKYLESLEQATNTSYKFIQYELHEALADLCSQMGDTASAFEHYKKFHSIREEVVSLQSNTRLKSLKFMSQVESAKREAELEKTKNAELQKAYALIEEKNKDITDSIYYAKRIQNSILPKDNHITALFPDHFVLYKPKDIVSGDFYWISNCAGKKIIAAVDCTGHGVPGAFMSMAGSSLLNEIVNEKNITSPTQILNHLRERLMQTLQQTGADGESKDGMDIALCVFDGNTLEFAGANNPLYLIRNKELQEFKSDKQPIGVHAGAEKPFTSAKIELQKGDTIYIFSDGYVDQFGGPNGKKFMSKRFKDLLLSISGLTLSEQKNALDKAIEEWKGAGQQVDDILVIGLRNSG